MNPEPGRRAGREQRGAAAAASGEERPALSPPAFNLVWEIKQQL